MTQEILLRLKLEDRVGPQFLYEMEDWITRVIQENDLGQITGHEIGEGFFTVFIRLADSDPDMVADKVMSAIKALRIPKGSHVSWINSNNNTQKRFF